MEVIISVPPPPRTTPRIKRLSPEERQQYAESCRHNMDGVRLQLMELFVHLGIESHNVHVLPNLGTLVISHVTEHQRDALRKAIQEKELWTVTDDFEVTLIESKEEPPPEQSPTQDL